MVRIMSILDVFWSKVDASGGDDSCWDWTAGKYKSGYGQFSYREGTKVTSKRAHRFAYEAVHGPVPDGLTLDHACRNIMCCNPAHMEPVTNRVNSLRVHSMDWNAAASRVATLEPHVLLTQQETAEVLGYATSGTMSRLRARREIASFDLPSGRRYAKAHLKRFVRARNAEMSA